MAELFPGFPPELPAFLHQLKLNNEKAWFEARRQDYERLCVEPSLAFIDAMGPEVAAFDPPHKAVAKTNGSFRRIYRDTRFSKDKTPYRTYLHLVFWTGAHPNRSPGIHVVLSPGGFGIGAGQWGFDKATLVRYRQAVSDRESFGALIKAVERAREAGCHLDKPALKRLPKGFAAEGEAAEFLRQTGIVVRNRNEDYPDGFFGPDCCAIVARRMRPLLALEKWLVTHVYRAEN